MPQQSQTQTQQLYSHASEPKPVQQRSKAKYREDEPAGAYGNNIMFDRRVVRGNTYASRIMPAETLMLGRPDATKPVRKPTSKAGSIRAARTPEPVEGRRHMDIQTDTYLEELTDTVPEADTCTQTDAFMDRPPTPVFVPAKTGVDAVTQIETGDLFDFDLEVEPILEVLVGKVLEQGLMEVLEEEELAAMAAHQAHFEQVRNAELVATQRMEAAERRKMEEKERRLKQERERRERERVVRSKVAASAFARGYLNGIVNSVFSHLSDAGFFADPVETEVAETFLPWLTQQAVAHLERGAVARAVVQRIVEAAVLQKAEAEKAAAARAEAEAVEAEAAAAADATAAAVAAAAELESIRGRASHVLSGLSPPLVTPERVAEMRAELVAKEEGDAEAKWEAAKQQAGDEARAAAEARLAEATTAAEAAAAEAEANGEEPSAAPEPEVDVEAAVAEAVAAVPKPEPSEVTDGDVLSALMDKGEVVKDDIVQALALDALTRALQQ